MPPKAIMSVLHNAEADYAAELIDEVKDAVGNIDHIRVLGQEVLVAAYVQSPYYGTSRILKGDVEQNEDKWQSKCFLILKMGEDAIATATKRNINVGDWGFGNVQEHWQLSIRGVNSTARKDERDSSKNIRPWGGGGWPCRYVLIGDIKGITTRPQDII